MTAARKIALVGLPGSGKSAVGRELATRLGWRCIDTDEEVERTAGRSVAEIFAAEGEQGFRNRERHALLHALAQASPAVIACGGGLVVDRGNRRALLDHTQVVVLDAHDEVLLGRLGNGSARPLLGRDPAAAMARLRAERRAAYEEAPLRVSAAGSVEQVAGAVMQAAGTGTRPAPSAGWAVDVGLGALASLPEHVPQGATRVALIADTAVGEAAARAGSALEATGRTVFRVDVDGGEGLKTWETAGDAIARLAQARIRRGDCVVALGGGTVGDLAGFVAATYLRGVAWVNAPTTLLAMVDSAVGGKTGVNLPQGKNLAGAFWHPIAIVADTALLSTLPGGAFRSALAEVVKYAMIGSEDMAAFVQNNVGALVARDADVIDEAVLRCIAAKTAVVLDDEREAGPRQVLNYGHTVAHALEAATGFGEVSHGEAVAAGMRVAGRLSERVTGCPPGDIAAQDELLDRCGFARVQDVDADTILERMEHDKKATASGVTWVLLRRRGEPVAGLRVDELTVRAALDEVLKP